MKVLVTGANGYLGSGIVKQLISFGIDVIATDIADNHLSNDAIIKVADIFSLENPYEFFDKPDVVLHLAWRNGFVHNSDTHIGDLNGHLSFLTKLAESGVSKIICMGSMHEIGFYEGRITDNTPCNPLSMYGIAKNSLRQALKLICDKNNVKYQWIRGFYIVGNSENGASIFSKIVSAVKNGQKTFPFTTGKNQYDFLNYDDFCVQVANVVINNDILGIINACSGEPVSLSKRVEDFIKENNYDIKLQYGVYPDRPYDSLAIWGDNSKINQIIQLNNKS